MASQPAAGPALADDPRSKSKASEAGDEEAAKSTKSDTATRKPSAKERVGAVTSAMWEKAHERYSNFVHEHEFRDSMNYQAQRLRSWRTMFILSNTVWSDALLWMVAIKLFFVSSIVSILAVFLVHDPAKLRVHRFADIVAFLRFFVGLMLGFFMSASVQRWWRCAGGFMELFDAVRNLQIQLLTMGVPTEKAIVALRFGVLSCWILTGQLEAEAMPEPMQAEAHDKLWAMLKEHQTKVGPADTEFGAATPEELEALRDTQDAAECLWIWIGMFIGELAKEQYIPPQHSPTYGRVMNIAQRAHDAIRKVRTNISIQAPYVYVHMLASLVHINNLLNAVSFGLTSGGGIGTYLAFSHHHPWGAVASRDDVVVDMQSVMASFFFSCFGPIVYQALLVVAITIAQPFSTQHAVVPTVKLIRSLEKDLHDAFMMNQNIRWEQPKYKPPAPAK
mmetsp:Transcript_6438/g.14082  ORF Transcript_6438/g.14082 Transcript_6438/m.14082 type:complete len:448 (-) Transcript_6438:254-1597(-)|eukprot:CAMPEP_0178413330 /NCGR_PEP_ID=MMETSP0689_2-20121128/22473_1 /TAXON_ID=160604 /ORGANISM="Amphidinium massartii, Strain CS-259" /LENGTH=447 /DNA_ID=CAMNT_0020034601 /DNA_START=110 /DNA_END=1453 /DNA_ORIENTATION=-